MWRNPRPLAEINCCAYACALRDRQRRRVLVDREDRRHSCVALAALPSIVGAPWIGKSAQRLEKDDEVGLLSRGEVERFRGPPVLRVQADGIEIALVSPPLRQAL